MSRTTYPRRRAWVAATLLGALSVVAAPQVQAVEPTPQLTDGESSVPPEDDDVVVPGGDPTPIPPISPIRPRPTPPGPTPPVPFPPVPFPQEPLPLEPPARVPLGDEVGSGALRIQPGAFGIGGPGVPGLAATSSAAFQSGVALDDGLVYQPTEKLFEAEVAPEWGKTKLPIPAVRYDVICIEPGKGTWQAITFGVQRVLQGVRMIDGVTAIDDGTVRATAQDKTRSVAERCTTLLKMSDDLINEADVAGTGERPAGPPPRPVTPTKYYMLDAVQAHEDLHVRDYKAAMAPLYASYKKAVESLVVSAESPAKAMEAVRLDVAKARRTLLNERQRVLDNVLDHQPSQPFRAAEHKVVDPVVTTIGELRTGLGCP